MLSVRQPSPFQSMTTPYFYRPNIRKRYLSTLNISIVTSKVSPPRNDFSNQVLKPQKVQGSSNEKNQINLFKRRSENSLLQSTSQGHLLSKIPGKSIQEGHRCLGSARSDSSHLVNKMENRSKEESFVDTSKNSKTQQKMTLCLQRRDKENNQQELKKVINIMMPIVHSTNTTHRSTDRDGGLYIGFKKDLQQIISIDKDLLKNQWLIFQKYEITLTSIIENLLKPYRQEFDATQSVLNCFLGINAIKKLFTYLDLTIDEDHVHKLFPFTNIQNVTANDIRDQILDVFVSPRFFIKKPSDHKQTSKTNLAEMQRVMRTIIELKLSSEETFSKILEKYDSALLQNQFIFEELCDNKILTPKSLAERLNCKADYCLHLLHRINPENCLQLSKERFYQAFTK